MDYFTSKLEIKPQLSFAICHISFNYFTSKLEIKPQLCGRNKFSNLHYFTSKLEIKPQLGSVIDMFFKIILHQN